MVSFAISSQMPGDDIKLAYETELSAWKTIIAAFMATRNGSAPAY